MRISDWSSDVCSSDLVLDREGRIFESGRAALRGQLEVLRQRIAQLVAQIGALRAQISAGEEQLAVVNEEVADVETLFAKGLERKPRLLALKSNRALIQGQQGEYAGRIAEAREGAEERRGGKERGQASG